MQINQPGMFSRGRIVLGRAAPHITPDSLLQELTQAWAPRGFNVYKSALIGLDVALKKSGWTGVAIKIKQKDGMTELVYNAFSPSAFVRMMAMGLIPLLIINASSWKPLLREFETYVKSSPFFHGGQLAGGQQPQLPQGQPAYQQQPQQYQQQPQQAQQAPQQYPCQQCGNQLQWVGQYQRWFCGACQQYR